MRTVRKPQQEVHNDTKEVNENTLAEDMTVEEYLQGRYNEIIMAFQKQTADQIGQLRQQYKDGEQSIMDMMKSSINVPAKKITIVLKCISGPHCAQKFRLEQSTPDCEEVFKLGRSTGRLFKEHGVSLYKDKEISTTHAKIEIRNGQVFYVDNKSTNGSILNNDELEAYAPYRLQNDDMITVGSSQLRVQINDTNDDNDGEDCNVSASV